MEVHVVSLETVDSSKWRTTKNLAVFATYSDAYDFAESKRKILYDAGLYGYCCTGKFPSRKKLEKVRKELDVFVDIGDYGVQVIIETMFVK